MIKPVMAILQGLMILCFVTACAPLNMIPTPEHLQALPTPSEGVSPISPIAPPAHNVLPAPPFRLDPLTPDSTVATGQGPIGFTLVIVDATAGARILGSGQPDENGNFLIPLNEALRPGHVIGLTVDLTPEQLSSDELINRLYEIRGPGFRFIPQVAIIFDAVEIPER